MLVALAETAKAYFEVYMDMFLLYLVVRFAKENKNAEVKDSILGRNVPCVVFIMNKRILEQAMQDQTELDQQKRDTLVHQAQVNEYLYLLMRKNGVLVHIDEKVGVEFIDFKKSVLKTSLVSEQVSLLDESTETPSRFL